MKNTLKAILVFISLTIITGVLYPLVVTIIAQTIFPWKSGGSIILNNYGTASGSALIGQSFSDSKYFWPRPSSTPDYPYNPLASTGSNLGPTNKDLMDQIKDRLNNFHLAGITASLPADAVMSSASGLDPDISLETALIQTARIAKSRQIPLEDIKALVMKNVDERQFGILGSKRVNVLKLNLAMDKL